MSLKRNQPALLFILTLCAIFALTNIHVLDLKAQNLAQSSTSQETASYPSLQPDQFMNKWLVLGPLPVSKDKPKPKDQATQKKAFDAELIEHEFATVTAGQSQQVGEKKT